MDNNLLYLWLGIIVVFSIAEAATLNIVTAWFVLGAIAATIANLLGAGAPIEIALFLIVSGISLAVLRPLAIRALKNKIPEKFNKDALIGKLGIVTTAIESDKELGEVKLEGKYYRAKSEDTQDINTDSKVEILRIKGITFIVKKVEG